MAHAGYMERRMDEDGKSAGTVFSWQWVVLRDALYSTRTEIMVRTIYYTSSYQSLSIVAPSVISRIGAVTAAVLQAVSAG